MTALVLAAVRFYQRYLRRFHNRECIYQPTCSEYTILVLERFGFLRGVRYGITRLRRCNGALYRGGPDWPDGGDEPAPG